MPRNIFSGIDFDPFGTGLDRSIARERAHLQLANEQIAADEAMGNRIEKQNVDTYLSSIPQNQATAGALGMSQADFWRNQQNSILADPAFSRLMPQTQRNILDDIRNKALVEAQGMFQRGEFEASRRLTESMGLPNFSNQLMEALQANNPNAVNQAMQNNNQQYGGTYNTETKNFSIPGIGEVPATVMLNEMSRRNMSQLGGAGAAAALTQEDFQRKKDAQDLATSQITEQKIRQDQATKVQAALLMAQLANLPQSPQRAAALQVLQQIAGISAEDMAVATQAEPGIPSIPFDERALLEQLGVPQFSIPDQEQQSILELPSLPSNSGKPPQVQQPTSAKENIQQSDVATGFSRLIPQASDFYASPEDTATQLRLMGRGGPVGTLMAMALRMGDTAQNMADRNRRELTGQVYGPSEALRRWISSGWQSQGGGQ